MDINDNPEEEYEEEEIEIVEEIEIDEENEIEDALDKNKCQNIYGGGNAYENKELGTKEFIDFSKENVNNNNNNSEEKNYYNNYYKNQEKINYEENNSFSNDYNFNIENNNINKEQMNNYQNNNYCNQINNYLNQDNKYQDNKNSNFWKINHDNNISDKDKCDNNDFENSQEIFFSPIKETFFNGELVNEANKKKPDKKNEAQQIDIKNDETYLNNQKRNQEDYKIQKPKIRRGKNSIDNRDIFLSSKEGTNQNNENVKIVKNSDNSDINKNSNESLNLSNKSNDIQEVFEENKTNISINKDKIYDIYIDCKKGEQKCNNDNKNINCVNNNNKNSNTYEEKNFTKIEDYRNNNNITKKDKTIINFNDNILKENETKNNINNNSDDINNIETTIEEKNKQEKENIIRGSIKKSSEEQSYIDIIILVPEGKEIIELLDNKKWEEKKKGFEKLNEILGVNEQLEYNLDIFFMFIYIKLNKFKETNFNLLKEGMLCINKILEFLKRNGTKTEKKYLEIILYNLYEKIADNKIKENYIKLLDLLIEIYSIKTVFDVLFPLLQKTNKIMVLKEYGIYLKKIIEEKNSIDNIELKKLIDFSIKLANNTNPQIRKISIEIICLLYKFIGPDLKNILIDIKESTYKIIEKELEKIDYIESTFDNSSLKKNIKNLITKNKNDKFHGYGEKRNSNKEEESKNINKNKDENNDEGVDISKEINNILLQDIQKGNWNEKKDAIELINKIIDKYNNKILINGLNNLFEIIKEKLKDKNQNLVRLIIQLLSHLLISLGPQVKVYSREIIHPLLLNLSDKNQLIREECLTCIDNWIKVQNFEFICSYFPSLLNIENFEMRNEIICLMIKYIDLITQEYSSIFFIDLTKSLLNCLLDKNMIIRNITENLIVKLSNLIDKKNYMKEIKELKPSIGDFLYQTIDKLFPEEIDKNAETKLDKTKVNYISPNKIKKNKIKKPKNENKSYSGQKEINKKMQKIKDNNNNNNIKIVKSNLLNENSNNKNKASFKNLPIETDNTRNKHKRNKNKSCGNYTVNIDKKTKKYNKNEKQAMIDNICNLNKKFDNLPEKGVNRTNKRKQKNSKIKVSTSIDVKLHIKNGDNSSNGDKSTVKKPKNLSCKKIINNSKEKVEIQTKNKEYINNKIIKSKVIDKQKKNKIIYKCIFLPNLKVKTGVKEKRYEEDKKHNFYLENQNFDYLPKIKEIVKFIFISDFLKALFSNDIKLNIMSFTQLKLLIDENISEKNEDNDLNKLIDNLDLILKIIAVKLFNNQAASLIKSFFIFVDTLINAFKIKDFSFNDIESNILLNIFIDKLNSNNIIIKETANNLIWFLNDRIGNQRTFIFLSHLLEYKNAKLKIEIIDIIITLNDCSSFDNNILIKTIKNLIRVYFDGDFSLKKKLLPLIQEISNSIGNDFWKITKFFPSDKKNELYSLLGKENKDFKDNEKEINFDITDINSLNFEDGDEFETYSNYSKHIENYNKINTIDKHNYITQTFPKNNNLNKKIINNKNFTYKKKNSLNLNDNSGVSANSIDNSKIISVEELKTTINELNNNEETMIDAILSIYDITYRKYQQNKEVILENIDIIISKFIEIIGNLFETQQITIKIKIIKYLGNVLCKLCGNKELIFHISFSIQKNLILLILKCVQYDNLNKLGENNEGMIIWKCFNSITLHLMEYCDITKNISILIEIEKINRKKNPKLAEYSARCLVIIIQKIKERYNTINMKIVFNDVYSLLLDLIKEQNDELKLETKIDQAIFITTKNIIIEISKAKGKLIIEEYNKIMENNRKSDKFIIKWIHQALKSSNINEIQESNRVQYSKVSNEKNNSIEKSNKRKKEEENIDKCYK